MPARDLPGALAGVAMKMRRMRQERSVEVELQQMLRALQELHRPWPLDALKG